MSLTIISLRLLGELGLVHQILPVTHGGQRAASVFCARLGVKEECEFTGRPLCEQQLRIEWWSKDGVTPSSGNFHTVQLHTLPLPLRMLDFNPLYLNRE